MANTPTTNYALNKPAEGDLDWDTTLNANFDKIDTILFEKADKGHGVLFDQSLDTYTRTGALAGIAVGISPGNALLPIHAQMRRCLLLDNGTVNYYLDPTDSTKKADGNPSVLTGADGQVMVEIPKCYYAYSLSGNVHRHDFARAPIPGLSVHPAFLKNGVEVPFRYYSAYEGSMWDATTSAMVAPANITTNMYAAGDKLCSLSGQYPKTNETRAEFRAMAANRGAGWRQQDNDLAQLVQALFLVEYASFNSQTMIGMGRTELIGGSWAANSYIGQCGKSNAKGNGTFSVGGNINDAYMTYRGIENLFGNIWKFVDGINIYNNTPYISNTDTQFADNTTTNYTALGITLVDINGWISTLCNSGRGFFPASIGGSSSTKVPDYYYQASGWRVVFLGSNAIQGAYAGAFCLGALNASSIIDVSVGGRLAF